jgi:beta-glucosidase
MLYKKSIFFVIVGLITFLNVFSINAQEAKLPYQNESLSMDLRVSDLISRLTLDEKIHQMMDESAAIARLNVPEYNYWNEGLHGVARSGVATVFPQAIGLGATFDEKLIKDVASAISDEARAMYNASLAEGRNPKYGGLTFWTPNINIFRDPRWGRGQETYGEDPFLTAKIGTAFVQGLQGDDPQYLKVAACAKHFAVHSGPEKLRHEFNAIASSKDLRETYLPAFKALVNANVEAVMCAYNRTNSELCCASNLLLDQILKKEWGFKGHVVTDCGAIKDFYDGHNMVPGKAEAAALAIKHQDGLNCGSSYEALNDAIKRGLIREAEIDAALTTVLKTRFKLGMFDMPGKNPYNSIPLSTINSSVNRSLAREAAQKSIVLLKNNGVLPLRNDLPKYYVTGPNAADNYVLMGNYYGVNPQMVSYLEGLAGAIKPGSQMEYKPGILFDKPNVNPIDWTTGAAKSSNVTFVVLGISGLIEGEEGESIGSSHFGDRLDYNLPQNQINFLKKLRQGNKNKIVTIITGGSPMNLKEVHELSDAVLLAWYPGEEGGNAVADLIFGKVSPSGKLPITFPQSFDQLPAYEDYSMQGRTYRYMSAKPLYPFGFGLSYGKFEYLPLKLSSNKLKIGEELTLETEIENVGFNNAEEVVQLYITAPNGNGKDNPLYSLKGIKRVKLGNKEKQTVSFTINNDLLRTVTQSGAETLLKGTYKIYVGGSSPNEVNQELGAPKILEASFILN